MCIRDSSLSDADGTRTRNLRIDSPGTVPDLVNKKPNQIESAKPWASAGASDLCKPGRQINVAEWLDSCPVELPAEVESAMLAMLRTLEQKREDDDKPSLGVVG